MLLRRGGLVEGCGGIDLGDGESGDGCGRVSHGGNDLGGGPVGVGGPEQGSYAGGKGGRCAGAKGLKILRVAEVEAAEAVGSVRGDAVGGVGLA